MKRILIVTAAIILLSQLAFSQSIDKAKLDKFFDTLEANNKFMGSLAVIRDGELIYSNSTGFLDINSKSKPDGSSKYRIGSISKTFTAVLVLKAIEEKKIRLDQTLGEFYPKIKNADKITIEHLLYHRSGIHSFTDDDDFQNWNTKPKNESELVEIIAQGNSEFEPNSKFEYSNPNYILLSFILQKLYKKSYSEILKDKIAAPAELKNTFFGKKIDLAKNEPNSFVFNDKWTLKSETDLSIPMGAGGIVSTPSDLAKFGEALFSGKLISQKSLEQMTTLKDRAGMGIFKMPFGENEGFGHTGAIDGFSSMFSYFPGSKVSFAMLSNGTNYSNNEIAKKVLSAVYNKPFDIPSFSNYEVSTEDLDKYLGIYSTTELPLKITITKKDKTLVLQATGQSPLELEAIEKDIFTFDRAGIVLEFKPSENKAILKQGGGTFTFTKE